MAIASVLIRKPSLLIIDQPFLGQDGRQKLLLSRTLLTLNNEGVTLIIGTHEVDFVCENLKRLILISKGKIIADGTPDDLLSSEKSLSETNLVVPQHIAIKKALLEKGFKPRHNFLQLYTSR